MQLQRGAGAPHAPHAGACGMLQLPDGARKATKIIPMAPSMQGPTNPSTIRQLLELLFFCFFKNKSQFVKRVAERKLRRSLEDAACRQLGGAERKDRSELRPWRVNSSTPSAQNTAARQHVSHRANWDFFLKKSNSCKDSAGEGDTRREKKAGVRGWFRCAACHGGASRHGGKQKEGGLAPLASAAVLGQQWALGRVGGPDGDRGGAHADGCRA